MQLVLLYRRVQCVSIRLGHWYSCRGCPCPQGHFTSIKVNVHLPCQHSMWVVCVFWLCTNRQLLQLQPEVKKSALPAGCNEAPRSSVQSVQCCTLCTRVHSPLKFLLIIFIPSSSFLLFKKVFKKCSLFIFPVPHLPTPNGLSPPSPSLLSQLEFCGIRVLSTAH